MSENYYMENYFIENYYMENYYIENHYIENQYFRSTCSVKSGQSGSKKRNGAAGPGKERRMRLEEMVDEAAKQQVNICSTFAEFFITFAVHLRSFLLHLQYICNTFV